jgi:hypothetical protein
MIDLAGNQAMNLVCLKGTCYQTSTNTSMVSNVKLNMLSC